MKTVYVLLLMLMTVFFCCPKARADAAKLTKQANRLYKEEKYAEALEKYKEAGNLKPDSDIIHFDAGAAFYKTGDYKNAVGSLTKALSTEGEDLEAKATYNIGNSKYRLGLLEESLDYYKRAIELDALDEDAKFNYEFVKKKLEEKQDQEKQKEQEQKKPQSQKEEKKEEEKEKEKKEQDQKEQEKKEQKPEERKPQEDKDERDKEEKEKEKKEQEEKEKEQKEGQEKKPEPEQRKEGMSEEETQMLLEGHRHEEESMGEVAKQRIRSFPEVLKDW